MKKHCLKDIDYYEFVDEKHHDVIDLVEIEDHLNAIIEYKEMINTLSMLRDENIVNQNFRQAQIHQAQIKHLDHKICNHLCCLE